MKRLPFVPVLALLVTACGLVIGIDPDLTVKPQPDAGDATTPDATKPPAPDATTTDVTPITHSWPKEGVYAFQQAALKQGYDNVSPGGNKPMYDVGTVTVHWTNASCFELTLSPRNGYTDLMRFCIAADGVSLDELTGERKQDFTVFNIGQHVDTLQNCAPGDRYFSYTISDAATDHDCLGENRDTKTGDSGFETAGPYTWVADETMTVMGKSVLVRHYRSHLTITGKQTGSNDNEWWFSLEDAMLVRWLRDVSIDYPNPPPFGPFTYTEHEDMTLVDAGTD